MGKNEGCEGKDIISFVTLQHFQFYFDCLKIYKQQMIKPDLLWPVFWGISKGPNA